MASISAPAASAVDEATDATEISVQSGSIAFPDLVRAHHAWERDKTNDPKLLKAWQDCLRAFQEQEGELRYAYWTRQRPSAVALTMKPRHWIAWLLEGDRHIIRLHRATDWTASERQIADLMHHCDTLAIRVSEVLRGTTERIAMQWLYSVQSHLLGFVERTQGRASGDQIDELIADQTTELLNVEAYYARAGEKAARIVYFGGMMLGAVAVAAFAGVLMLALALTGWLTHKHAFLMEGFFISYASGGVGAVVSVLMRMTGAKFNVDYEVGRGTIRWLGSFRPLIGAIFGIALYAFVRSGIPMVTLPSGEKQTLYYFASFAFLAGFNERWANVLFGKAEQSLAGRLGSGTKDDA